MTESGNIPMTAEKSIDKSPKNANNDHQIFVQKEELIDILKFLTTVKRRLETLMK
jgi:hypothetical protein